MTLYSNPCSYQYRLNDREMLFYRRFLIGVILFQIIILTILRVCSRLKNHDLHLIKKQLQEKKRLEKIAIIQTMQTLNNNFTTLVNQNQLRNLNQIAINNTNGQPHKLDLTNPEQNVLKQLSPNNVFRTRRQTKNNSSKQARKRFKRQKNILLNQILMKSFLPTALEKGKCLHKKQITDQKGKSQSECSSSSDQSQAQNQQSNSALQSPNSNQESTNKADNGHCEDNKHFINLHNLKVSIDQASRIYHILVGHFFISLSIAFTQSPTLYSSIFGGSHALILIFLVIWNICISNKQGAIPLNGVSQKPIQQNQIKINIMEIQSINLPDKTVQSGLKLKMQDKDLQPTKKLKSRISYLLMSFLLAINVCLLSYCLIQIKSSYFNVIQQRCA